MQKIVIWDVPTRLFHWLTAVLVLAAYVTWRLNWMDWHAWSGYAVLALVLFRLLWGFFGSDSARFARFLAAPRTVLRYLSHIGRRERDRQAGHNPAGGWMVLLMLVLLLGETLTGIYVNNDVAVEGPFTQLVRAPLADLITDLHDIFWQILLVAVVLHILAVIFYWAIKRHNLVLPMITGRKLLAPGMTPPTMAGPLRALLLLCGGVLITAALVHFL
jgi:cytochrome b